MSMTVSLHFSYCDGWCERCAFQDRCSAHACQVAIGMCGDAAEGLALAIGAPRAADKSAIAEAGASEFFNISISEDDLAEAECQEALCGVHALMLCRWSTWRDQTYAGGLDGCVSIAMNLPPTPTPLSVKRWRIVSRDTYFIGVKLHRALDGRDRFGHDDGDGDDHPVERLERIGQGRAVVDRAFGRVAWHVLTSATGDVDALGCASATGILRKIVLDEFPNAKSFVRPGFDDGRIGGPNGSRNS